MFYEDVLGVLFPVYFAWAYLEWLGESITLGEKTMRFAVSDCVIGQFVRCPMDLNVTTQHTDKQ